MGLASAASGTQTATVNTEHSLSTQTGAGVYVLIVDTVNMVNGDTVEVRLKTKALTGGAVGLAFSGSFANVQAEPLKFSIPVPSLFSIEATLKQVGGTSRAFDWQLATL